MEVMLSYKLEDFEGPLDLLLQLIAKNKLNINDIKLTVLIDQYLAHIEKMQITEDMDVASDFLQMASRLIYIKTVSLLPKHEEIEQLREQLTGELIEYQICREMAVKLGEIYSKYDRFIREPQEIEVDKTYVLTHNASVLYDAYLSAAGRGMRKMPVSTAPFTKIVAKKIVSVSSKIVFVLRNLVRGGRKKLSDLYSGAKSRSELVATFLAVLELCKNNRIQLVGEKDKTELQLIKEKKNEN
jgi:segregation and condensation protein A